MLNRVRVSFGLRALHRRAKAVRRVNDLGRRRSLDADTAVRMRGVGIHLGQLPVLDSRHYAASGNAHGAVGVKLLDGHGHDYDCIIWETLTTTKWSRNQSSKPYFTAETQSSQRSEYFVIKNSPLCALSASAVTSLLNRYNQNSH